MTATRDNIETARLLYTMTAIGCSKRLQVTAKGIRIPIRNCMCMWLQEIRSDCSRLQEIIGVGNVLMTSYTAVCSIQDKWYVMP